MKITKRWDDRIAAARAKSRAALERHQKELSARSLLEAIEAQREENELKAAYERAARNQRIENAGKREQMFTGATARSIKELRKALEQPLIIED